MVSHTIVSVVHGNVGMQYDSVMGRCVHDECSRPIRVFQRGSVYSGSTGYVKSSGACTEVNLSYVTGYTFYIPGQEVPLSAFQMMIVSVE